MRALEEISTFANDLQSAEIQDADPSGCKLLLQQSETFSYLKETDKEIQTNFHPKLQKLSKQAQDEFKPDSGQGNDFVQLHLGPPRKLATQTIVTLPHVPDKIFKRAEGDHSAHPLARWSERIV